MIVKYSKKFPYAPYLNEDIGYEKSIPDNATEEEMIQAGVDLNRIATATFNKLNPGASPTPSITDYNTGELLAMSGAHGTQNGILPEDERMKILIKDIGECTVIDEKNSFGVQTGLLGYKSLAEAHPSVQDAYNQRLKELS